MVELCSSRFGRKGLRSCCRFSLYSSRPFPLPSSHPLLLLLLMPFNYYFTSRGVHQRSGISVSSSSNKNASSSPLLFFFYIYAHEAHQRERGDVFDNSLSPSALRASSVRCCCCCCCYIHLYKAAAAAAIRVHSAASQAVNNLYREHLSLCSALIFNNTSTTMRCDATTP